MRNYKKRLKRFLYAKLGFSIKASLLSSPNLDLDDFEVDEKSVFWKKYNLTFNEVLLHFIPSLDRLEDLFNLGFKGVATDTNLIVSYESINFNIENVEEINILHEIYLGGDYNLITNKEFVFLDIGMNVGFTSLYFANNKNCIQVHGFEPFPDTASKCNNNLLNNPLLAKKISLNNFGLSNFSGEVEVDYIPSVRGSIGINNPEWVNNLPSSLKQKKKIQIKSASVLKNYLSLDTKEVVCKIDCEGSEYEIIDKLIECNIIKDIGTFLIEWHYKGPDYISSKLSQEGFSVLSLRPKSPNIGMIYAFRK